MVTNEIYIQQTPDVIYLYLEKELCKAFSCQPGQLLGKKITHTQKIYGKTIEMDQEVTERVKGESLAFVSVYGQDSLVVRYQILADDEGWSRVILTESADSTNKFKSLNYKLFSLPVLRNVGKKKLYRKLTALKLSLEKE